MDSPKKIKISELEEISNTPRTTIHYYIREGILHRPDKTGRTMAYYDGSHLRRLKLIKKIQRNYKSEKNKTYMPIPLLKRKLVESDSHPGYKYSIEGKREFEIPDKRESRKQEIIEAALSLYSEKGYYSTNVRDIARQAGISPSAFYIYFPDKRELFGEVIEHVMTDIADKIRGALKEEEDELKRPIVFLKIFKENYSRVGEILNQLRAGMALNDEWARKKLRKVYLDMTLIMTEEVKNATAAGFTRETDPEVLSIFIVGMTEIVLNLTFLYDKYTFERLAMFATELYVNGVARKDERSQLFYAKLVDEIKTALGE
jgi:AcrR family transcriptional regulator